MLRQQRWFLASRILHVDEEFIRKEEQKKRDGKRKKWQLVWLWHDERSAMRSEASQNHLNQQLEESRWDSKDPLPPPAHNRWFTFVTIVMSALPVTVIGGVRGPSTTAYDPQTCNPNSILISHLTGSSDPPYFRYWATWLYRVYSQYRFILVAVLPLSILWRHYWVYVMTWCVHLCMQYTYHDHLRHCGYHLH